MARARSRPPRSPLLRLRRCLRHTRGDRGDRRHAGPARARPSGPGPDSAGDHHRGQARARAEERRRLAALAHPRCGEDPRRHGSARHVESWLLIGAFADLSRKRHLPLVYGCHDPDRISGRATPPPATPAVAAALEAQVRQMVADTAGTSGVQLLSLQILRAGRARVCARAEGCRPGGLHESRAAGPAAATHAARSGIDGSYVVLTDATGGVVWMSAGSTRAGAGTNYARSDLAGCNPIVNFGVLHAPPRAPRRSQSS